MWGRVKLEAARRPIMKTSGGRLDLRVWGSERGVWTGERNVVGIGQRWHLRLPG